MKLLTFGDEIRAALLDGEAATLLGWADGETADITVETVASLTAAEIDKLSNQPREHATVASELRRLATENAQVFPEASFKAFLKAAEIESRPPEA